MNWSFIILPLFFYSFAWSKDLVAEKTFNDPELKIKVYGSREVIKKKYNLENLNPLQPETVSISIPGLNIAKLGGLGQKTSLVYNGLTSGDMTFLFDGFEVSDISDPSEGFDLTNYMMVPNFDFSLSKDSSGLFYRQMKGGISIDPIYDNGKTLRTSGGSLGQGLVSYQDSSCTDKECFQFGLGGTYADGLSASVNPRDASSGLEKDSASQYFLSLGWLKTLSTNSFLKLRSHTQYSDTEIDDYNDAFVLRDDLNSDIKFLNQFLGFTYSDGPHQFFLENIYSQRIVVNEADVFSRTERNDTYQVLRSKVRGLHQINKLDLQWSLQNVNLKTETLSRAALVQNKLEFGSQATYDLKLKNIGLKQSLSFNTLESFDYGVGINQTLKFSGWNLSSDTLNFKDSNKKLYFQTQYGYKDRRPSFFQLFDPQFGNRDLTNEKQLFIRPQLDFVWLNSDAKKHNISMSYSLEDIKSKVIFQNIDGGKYSNSGSLNLNNLILEYSFATPTFNTRAFLRYSLDSESVTKVLPWTAQNEVGFGMGLKEKLLSISADFKWLYDMYNPSQNKIKELVQSQINFAYQMDTRNRISLQLNNLFNDKKIWDEGFNRQPFSWMITLTKNI